MTAVALWFALSAVPLNVPVGVSLADVYRFPPRDVVVECRSFAYYRWQWYDDNECIWFRGPRFRRDRAAAKLAYFALDDLDTAQREEFPPDSRLWALDRLKKRIGADAYDRGELPLFW